MKIFLWGLVASHVLEVIFTLGCLARQKIPVRTPGSMAFNAVLSLVMAACAAYLLTTVP